MRRASEQVPAEILNWLSEDNCTNLLVHDQNRRSAYAIWILVDQTCSKMRGCKPKRKD